MSVRHSVNVSATDLYDPREIIKLLLNELKRFIRKKFVFILGIFLFTENC